MSKQCHQWKAPPELGKRTRTKETADTSCGGGERETKNGRVYDFLRAINVSKLAKVSRDENTRVSWVDASGRIK